MPKPLPKITYPTKYIEEYPAARLSKEEHTGYVSGGHDPYSDMRDRNLFGSSEQYLEDIPLSAFDHEPFQKALDTLEEHFNIFWDGEASIQHGRRARRKGALYKTHSEFGHMPYTIFIKGIMSAEDGSMHDVRFRYHVAYDEDIPKVTGHWNPKYWATLTPEEKEKDRLSRWDMGTWALYIDGTKIPHHAIRDIIRGGKGGLDEWEQKDLEKTARPLGIKGDLDWS